MDRLLKLNHVRLLFLLLSCRLLQPSAVAAQEFPYVAYVAGESVYVRSGPGQRHYPTSQLSPGYAVEVYRHDADGWCAIRPPEGSFSWVPSHQVRPTDRGVVEVVDDHVVARVGSTMSPVRSAVQVLLPKGELLQQLSAGANEDPRWVRVTAPAGEFRWIAASDLSRQPPMEVLPLDQSKAAGWTRQGEQAPSSEQAEPSVFDHLTPVKETLASGLQFGAPPKLPINQPPANQQLEPHAMEVVAGSPAELQLAQFQAQAKSLAPAASIEGSEASALTVQATQPRVRFRGLAGSPTATIGSVEELELQLSQTVVQPPEHWELSPLETAANALLTQTTDPPVRAQLREVLDRITRFQQVQNRYRNPVPSIEPPRDPFELESTTNAAPAFTGMSASVRERIREDLKEDMRIASSPSVTTAEHPRYDATGLLKPVVSKRENAPQYALVDEQGKVISFVTPTPDLNLKPYVGRRIGVNGKRGFMPEYRRAHVTAGRVSPIETTLRR